MKELLLAAKSKIEKHTIEGLGEVYIRVLTAREWDTWVKANKANESNLSAKFCALTLCDEQGQRIFKTEDEIAKLGEVPLDILKKINELADALNFPTEKKAP